MQHFRYVGTNDVVRYFRRSELGLVERLDGDGCVPVTIDPETLATDPMYAELVGPPEAIGWTHDEPRITYPAGRSAGEPGPDLVPVERPPSACANDTTTRSR